MIEIYDIYEDKINSEPEVYCGCYVCGEDIFIGDEYILADGCCIHEDCFEEFAYDILSPSLRVAEYDD